MSRCMNRTTTNNKYLFNDNLGNYSLNNITRTLKSIRLIIFPTDSQKQTEPFVRTSLSRLSLMSTAWENERNGGHESKCRTEEMRLVDQWRGW